MAGYGFQPGHPRFGGRQKGTRNKADTERELEAARKVIDARRDGDLALDVLKRLLKTAEGAADKHRPSEDLDQNGRPLKGDWTLFGEWFDRTVSVAKEVVKYQSPRIAPIEAPAPPPDPNAGDAEPNCRRFGLRVFEGGKPLPGAA